MNGDRAGAQREFGKILVQAPNVAVDQKAFPPALIAAAERTRAAVQADSGMTVNVSAFPPGLAWIDGHTLGPTPQTVGHLPEGEHLIVVAAPGEQLAVTASSSTQVRVTLTHAAAREELQALRAQLAAAFLRADRTPKIAAAAQSLSADQLLVVALEEGDAPVLHLVRVSAEGRPLAAAEGNAGADPVSELQRLLPRVLEKDAPAAAQLALVGSEERVGQRGQGIDVPGLAPWFGAGAVALAGGSLAFALSANVERKRFANTEQTDLYFSTKWARATRQRALTADIFGGAAGLVGLLALSFWLEPGLWGWHPPQGGAPEDAAPPPEPRKKDVKPEDDLRESLRLDPVVLPAGGALALTGRF